MTSTEVTLRRATPADARPTFELSMASMRDLFARQGNEWKLDPEAFWTVLEPFLTHLTAHAAEWWVAEDPADGSVVGYARSIERGESAGLGRRLMERAYPLGRGDVRAIIATTDVRGLRRYYAAGTVARFAMASLAASPKPARSSGDLETVLATFDDLPEIAAIEEAVFGYPRHADYPWLFAHRESYLYRRAGRAVGFAFFSETGQGPIAALEPADRRSPQPHDVQRTLREVRSTGGVCAGYRPVSNIALGTALA